MKVNPVTFIKKKVFSFRYPRHQVTCFWSRILFYFCILMRPFCYLSIRSTWKKDGISKRDEKNFILTLIFSTFRRQKKLLFCDEKGSSHHVIWNESKRCRKTSCNTTKKIKWQKTFMTTYQKTYFCLPQYENLAINCHRFAT